MKVCAHSGEEHSQEEAVAKGSRLATLLGEMRREKNGAVADFMRFYGEKYGLNYGVSLPTIRAIAREQAKCAGAEENYKFAKQLYKQQVRELRLSAFYFADAEVIKTADDLAFWAQGVINSEVAEEAAFALLYRVESVSEWLNVPSALLQYCSIMALAKRCEADKDMALKTISDYSNLLLKIVDDEPHLTPKAVVALLDTALRVGVDTAEVERFISSLREGSVASTFIKDEISWRLDLR